MTGARMTSLGLALVATALTPAAGLAKHGADDGSGDDRGGDRASRATQIASGRCTGNATAKLKAKHDDGRIEAEFEVDQNRAGARWSVRLSRDGVVVVRTSAVTAGRSGSFSVERRLADGAGTDRISARAVSAAGQVCTATVTI